MDLSSPISSVIPSAHGAVLAVLARTTEPLSGRRVAALTDGRVGQWRTNEVLGALSESGIVLREERPPAKLYRLNRDHVAAAGIVALAQQWDTLLQRIREELAGWLPPPEAACLFGSAARGEAADASDLDILLVPARWVASADAEAHDPAVVDLWQCQVDQLVEHVRSWAGNSCEVLELTIDELSDAVARDDRLVADLKRDAISLAGADIRALLRRDIRAGR